MNLSKKTLLTIFFTSICINAFSDENNINNLSQEEKILMGPPPGANTIKTSKISTTEGDWTFDIITQTEGTSKKVTSSVTYYSGKNKSIVIIPSILGGAPVTKISSQAFGHHGEINAVYVPDSVEEVSDWAFYDLNTADFISFANPNVKIDESAFQSSGNAKLYLPSNTAIKSAGGKSAVTEGTEKLTVNIKNTENVVIGGESYLNIIDSPYTITKEDIKNISKSTGNIIDNSNSLIFEGTPYEVKEEKIEIFKDFENIVSATDLNETFKSFSKGDAQKENDKIAEDSSYKEIKSILNFEEGYYVNGNKVEVDNDAVAFDIKTGEKVYKDNGLYPSTGKGKYKYVFYKDSDNDGDIDEIYYSPYEQKYTYDSVKIQSSNSNLNNLNARDSMNPLYLSFANGVIEAQNEKITLDKAISIDTSLNGQRIDATANQERSILWANNYGVIEAKEVNGTSTSKGNWAKMSYETGLSSYNVEIVMEWGMNALLYATNGGTIKVGDLEGNQSKFYSNGDGANGIIAGGTGIKDEKSKNLAETSKVYVYNSYFDLQGWNNHIADVVYGGYAYLENVESKTGKIGSYSVGQGSALANDFGNGVVEVKDFVTTTYGNRSAGAYVIGGGIITAQNSSFTSIMDAGLVIASGGTYKVEDSKVTGQIAIRNRGGIVKDSTSTFNDVEFNVIKSYESYTTGTKAKEAVDLWEKYSGSENLSHFMMSDNEMTLGKLFRNYNISETSQTSLLSELSKLADSNYTKDTLLRNSLLDNTYYNYSAGKFTRNTDFSDVPYLTVGSSFGGLVSSIVEFEAAGVNMVFNNSTFKNSNGKDFDYLIASEAGSSGNVVFNNSNSQGIIWNEGDVFRVVEGRPENRSSSLDLTFNSSNFTGSFADGDKGLWNVNGLKYKNSKNIESSLNGNYYGANSNFGISAKFSNNSNWIINKDSYLGKLTLDSSSKITAPKGFKVEMTVNGVKTSIEEGTYEGEVVLSLVKL